MAALRRRDGAVICKPGGPEAKGLVERTKKSLETSSLPGRRFDSPADFNNQLGFLAPRRGATCQDSSAHGQIPVGGQLIAG